MRGGVISSYFWNIINKCGEYVQNLFRHAMEKTWTISPRTCIMGNHLLIFHREEA